VEPAAEAGAPVVEPSGAQPTAPAAAADAEASAEPVAEAAEDAAATPESPAEAAAAPKPPDLAPAACAALLAQHFPALFGAGRALPIKLRVQADIQQRVPGVFSRKSLSIFLHRHTTSTPYIKALLAAPHRYDLDGQPAGEVAEEHRAAATAELDRRQAIVQARRAAEREALNAARRAGQRAAPIGEAASAADATAPGSAGENTPNPRRAPRGPAGERPPGQPRSREQGREQGRPARPSDRPRREGRPDDRRPPRPAHDAARPPRPPRPQAPEATAAAPVEPAVPLTPEQAAEHEARRSRAAVLRAFETTTLTRANFCALKGMNDAALEAILVQARAERGPRQR
jgi:sRNA-binding protein